MHPMHSLETFRPVVPSVVYFMLGLRARSSVKPSREVSDQRDLRRIVCMDWMVAGHALPNAR
jgi:hypothetical protein